jgi:hypothetical protein
MPKRLVLCLALVLLVLGSAHAQEEKKAKKVLKNADIVLMTQNHFDDDTLTKIIEVSDTDFDVSTDALVALMKQGVSSNVCRAMLASTRKKKTASPPPNPEPSAASATAPSASTALAPAQAAATASATNIPDSNFAVRPSSTSTAENSTPAAAATPPSNATAAANAAPAVNATPLAPARPMNPAAMYPGAMGISPEQMAMVQSQLASMGMGGMMGGMGPGGMGGMGMPGMGSFAMNYSPEQMPHVFLKLGANQGKQEISASMAQIGQSKFNGGMGAGGMALRSLATEGLSFAAMGAGPGGMMAMSAFSMVSGFMPGMRPGAPKITYVWGLPGRTSSRTLGETDPIFELNYGDIPGVDPDAYEPAVLKLVQTKDNYRLVGATQIKMTAKNMRTGASPENGKWLSEDRWPSHCDKEERGFYVLRVDAPLEPGEYAVVLRPVKGYKAPSSGLGGHAQVFYSVWDFSVPGATPEDGKKKKKK